MGALYTLKYGDDLQKEYKSMNIHKVISVLDKLVENDVSYELYEDHMLLDKSYRED